MSLTADLIDKPPEDVSTFQGMIAVLQAYWAKQGCIVQQPYDMEMGAGTFHASTFLRAIGPEPWHVCHTQASRRPTDGRYGENPNRLQHYYQFQVAMKPSPVNIQDLYLGSLEALGFDLLEDDVRFVEDNWESPTLGAWGLGWEVWLNGMEVTQYTYFQQCGGLPCAPVLGELAYGIERLAMYIQGVESVYDLVWGVTPAGTITYGDVFHQNEVEQSAYNFEHADTEELFHSFSVCEANCQRLVEENLPLPAYEQVLRGSHTFNLLDARHAISVTERQRYILRVRGMSRAVAESYLQSREQLGFPLLRANELRTDKSQTDKSAETMPRIQADSGQSSDSQESLLIEIGVEELPAGSALPMAEFLGAGLHDLLQANDFEPGTYQVFSTPRRLAVLVASVRAAQSDRDVEKRGPALSAAYDAEGKPSKALSGFARSCGVEPEKLERMKTDKGEWLVHRSSQKGQPLAQFIDAQLPKLIRQMPMPKRMRWSDKDVEFLRPVLWLTALHGKNVLQLALLGQAAGRETRGHRFHARDSLQLESADSYEARLSDAFVIADFDKRREVVVQQVKACATEFGASVVMDENLVDEVTSLVEWPVALTGHFDEHFLELPKEALIQTMEENQRYFALLDSSGALLPGFITVANIESKQPEKVRQGNERVIRPRFSDTMFFWKNDCRKTLESHRDALSKVLFQEKLGSVLDKTKRLESLASVLAEKLGANQDHCVRAAALSKCDLLTEIVTELPKMQGIAGRYYAEIEGEPADVSKALQDQYLPIKSGGELPDSLPGQILAIADKTDTLVGIFGIGQRPTGAKDPFGLRRASVGLLRIIIENGLELDLTELLDTSRSSFGARLDSDVALDEVLDYILERLRSYYQEKGVRTDVVDAVMARHITRPVDFDRRVKAIAAFRETDAAASLSAANKRIQNILKKVETAVPESINQELLTESAEKSLASDLQSIASELAPQFEGGNYAEAMRSTAKLRPAVDAFFDNVMVMVDDEPIRNNRLALLQQVGQLCSHTADLSRLQLQDS